MGMMVDEPGGDDPPLDVDRSFGGGAGVFANPDDLVVLDATSAANAGSPEPSTTRPFLMSRSYAMLIPPDSTPASNAKLTLRFEGA